MREIKFRGLVRTGRWVYGSLVIDRGEPFIYWRDEAGLHKSSVLPETVGEYIGLKDKNGVEIYEDDICKNEIYGRDLLWVWEYRVDGEYIGFLPVCISDKRAGRVSTFMSWTSCEVIGNIDENPEPLEKAS
ncbi:YopX family protein [Streptomyces iakyrus]|uniref:YopX family protein n=1 Tax=Streptomyces iakyrus TaxID=68219 RepID=UPI0036EC563C